jgi:hypothetical protein
MNKQLTLSAGTEEVTQGRTKKKEFLEQLERIIPLSEWMAEKRPHYYKGERGNKPFEQELMLRIHLIRLKKINRIKIYIEKSLMQNIGGQCHSFSRGYGRALSTEYKICTACRTWASRTRS